MRGAPSNEIVVRNKVVSPVTLRPRYCAAATGTSQRFLYHREARNDRRQATEGSRTAPTKQPLHSVGRERRRAVAPGAFLFGEIPRRDTSLGVQELMDCRGDVAGVDAGSVQELLRFARSRHVFHGEVLEVEDVGLFGEG